jgi:hypothetical protein
VYSWSLDCDALSPTHGDSVSDSGPEYIPSVPVIGCLDVMLSGLHGSGAIGRSWLESQSDQEIHEHEMEESYEH